LVTSAAAFGLSNACLTGAFLHAPSEQAIFPAIVQVPLALVEVCMAQQGASSLVDFASPAWTATVKARSAAERMSFFIIVLAWLGLQAVFDANHPPYQTVCRIKCSIPDGFWSGL
jgi:hypothetical protein